METTEGQLAYIESTLRHAKDNTTGHTQLQITRSLEMFPLVKSAVQNMKARVDTLDDE